MLQLGTEEEVRETTRTLLQTVSTRGGHLMNSGEMVPRDTPEANMRAYAETVQEYGRVD